MRSRGDWLRHRLQWVPDVDELAADAGAAGGGLLGGAGLAELIGLSGPAGILIGAAAAVPATVFRRRSKNNHQGGENGQE